jgi:hypothetical protein
MPRDGSNAEFSASGSGVAEAHVSSPRGQRDSGSLAEASPTGDKLDKLTVMLGCFLAAVAVKDKVAGRGDCDKGAKTLDLRGCRQMPQTSESKTGEDPEDPTIDDFESAVPFPQRTEDKKGSTFDAALESLEKFFSTEDDVGDDISESFSKIINSSLRRRSNEDNIKKVMAKYPRPKNLTNLVIPKTNKDVLQALRKGTAIVDGLIQKVQMMLSKATVVFVKCIDDIGCNRAGSAESYLESLMDGQLSAAFSTLCQIRKDVIRNDLGEPMARLCTWDTAVGQQALFDCDATKKCKEGDESSYRIGQKRKHTSNWKQYHR